MKKWYLGLAVRERQMVLAGAVLLALLLLYALIWSPLHDAYTTMREGVADQRDTAVWMQGSARQLGTLRAAAGPAARGLGGKSLLALADSTARAGGLDNALKRVEPEGSEHVRVWLEGAAFDVLMQWLVTLDSRYGIAAETVSLERVEDQAGRVNARITLQATVL